MAEKNCYACSYSYMEPDSPLICGHKDSGTFGLHVPRRPADHCGPDRTKFEQHPKRNPNGSLKSDTPKRTTALDVLDGAKR